MISFSRISEDPFWLEWGHSPAGKVEMAIKLFRWFEGWHENALIQSCEMSPHLICLECGSKHSPTGKVEMAKKLFRGFEGCHENALIQSFEMSRHLICWEFRSKTFNGQPNPDPIQRLAIKGFGPELSTYQEGAHFEALDEGILMVPLKSSEQFFRHFNFPCRTVPSIGTSILYCVTW